MNLSAIDLNLLVVLEALVTERSVTRAAYRVGLSQPATSNALRRLRSLLDDQILVRSAGGMLLTPRAEALRSPLRQALDEIRAALGAPPEFDPSRSDRIFHIQAMDQVQAAIAFELSSKLEAQAPGVTLEMRSPGDEHMVMRSLESGEADLAVGNYRRVPRGIHQATLLEDRIVCIVRKDHPRIGGRLTAAAHRDERKVGTAMFMDVPAWLEHVVEDAAVRGHRRLTMSTTLALPFIAARTDLIAHSPERLVSWLLPSLGLRALPLPVKLPPVRIELYWHRRLDADPGHRWLREQLLQAFATPVSGADQGHHHRRSEIQGRSDKKPSAQRAPFETPPREGGSSGRAGKGSSSQPSNRSR